MVAASIPDVAPAPDEQRMLLHDVSWKEYVIFRAQLEQYGAEYVALVNSDVVVSPATVAVLVALLADRPEVAAIGPLLRLPDGRLQTGAAESTPARYDPYPDHSYR